MEIETKAKLAEDEYLRLSKIFTERNAELIIKDDFYYTQYKTLKKRIKHNEPFIRVRIENNKNAYLTIKRKNIIDGKEYNIERETQLSNPKALEELLDQLGSWIYFTKRKWSQSLYDDVEIEGTTVKVHCELETVNNTFKYLEIECTDDINKEIASKALNETLRKYGISFDKIDERDWPDILGKEKGCF